MRVFSIFFIFGASLLIGCSAVNEDNEFAEFEDDFTDIVTDAPAPAARESEHQKDTHQKPKVAKFEDEFEEEDFGIAEEETEESKEIVNEEEKTAEDGPPQPLKFADVPAHFRSNWASYQVEALVIIILLFYMVNYLIGRTTNLNIATEAFEHCLPLLEEQFSLVSDDGVTEINEIQPILRKDTDYTFSSWCTGRSSLNYFHWQLRTQKRQDLVSRVMDFFNPTNDRITIKILLESAADTDPLIIAVGEKKTVNKAIKEMMDLGTFTTERKQTASQFNLPVNYNLCADQNEVVYSMLEPGIVNLLKKHEKAVDLIHISDQYTGPRPPEGETYTKLPDAQRIMMVQLNLNHCNDAESMQEILNLVFYLVEKVRRFKLSKDAKIKAEKRRKEFEEVFLRSTHQFRQEAAQARREEKTRERKQKLLDEADPDRQRRLEAKELKREAKAKQPKMKQLKVK